MDPFEEMKYLGFNLPDIEEFDYTPSHSLLSERLRKTLYIAQDGISLPVADAAVDVFQSVSGFPLRKISPRHVANLSKRSRVAPCTLLLAMIYARRLHKKNQTYLQSIKSTDLLLVSMMVASKFLYDEGEDEEMFSDEWAQAANVDVKRVYELEMEFLSALDWDLFVHADEFYDFTRKLETRIALKEGLSRGWFSYSDLEVLMARQGWWNTWTTLTLESLKVIGLCITVYTVCASTIIWAALVIHHVQLASPSQQCHLPSSLDSHLKKSTLIHLYPGEVALGVIPSSQISCTPTLPNKITSHSSGHSDSDTPTEVNSTDCNMEYSDGNDFNDLSTKIHQKYLAAKGALMVFCQALVASWNDYANEIKDYSKECCCCHCLESTEVKRNSAEGMCKCDHRSEDSVSRGGNKKQFPHKCRCHYPLNHERFDYPLNHERFDSNEAEPVNPNSHSSMNTKVMDPYKHCTWTQSPTFAGGGALPNHYLLRQLLWTFTDLQVGFATSSHMSVPVKI